MHACRQIAVTPAANTVFSLQINTVALKVPNARGLSDMLGNGATMRGAPPAMPERLQGGPKTMCLPTG